MGWASNRRLLLGIYEAKVATFQKSNIYSVVSWLLVKGIVNQLLTTSPILNLNTAQRWRRWRLRGPLMASDAHIAHVSVNPSQLPATTPGSLITITLRYTQYSISLCTALAESIFKDLSHSFHYEIPMGKTYLQNDKNLHELKII